MSKSLPDNSVREGPSTSHTHQQHELNRAVISTSSSSHLRHFLNSLLATTHFDILSGGYLVNQISPQETQPKQDSRNISLAKRSGSLCASHAHRLRLVQRLLVALELSGMLNDANMCLQIVVHVYGLLSPWLQHQLPSKDLLRLLVHCHVVLMELPENTLLHTLSSVTCSLHHLMAVTMYYIAKVRKVLWFY